MAATVIEVSFGPLEECLIKALKDTNTSIAAILRTNAEIAAKLTALEQRVAELQVKE